MACASEDIAVQSTAMNALLRIGFFLLNRLTYYDPAWSFEHKVAKLGLIAVVSMTPPGHAMIALILFRAFTGRETWSRPQVTPPPAPSPEVPPSSPRTPPAPLWA